jgi:hypothetical protein
VGSDLKEQLEAMYPGQITQLEEENFQREQFEAELRRNWEIKTVRRRKWRPPFVAK